MVSSTITTLTTTAEEGHSWEPSYSGPEIRLVRTLLPTLVLGSAQPVGLLDDVAAKAAGYEVVRRRSGGGVVELGPSSLWVDVAIPRDDPRWQDDVGRASVWVGRAWAEALAEHLRADLASSVEVHEGPPLASEAGRTACFAGVGAGEVLVGGRKVVGISQRRTRAGAWFQCVAYRSWSPGWLRLLSLDECERAQVEDRLTRHAAGLDEIVRGARGSRAWATLDEVVVDLVTALDAR